MRRWLLLLGAICTEVTGTLSLRASQDHTAWLGLVVATLSLRASEGFRKRAWITPVVLGYVLSFALLSASLRAGMPVGIAYGVWSACGVALVAVAARVLFAEPLTLPMVAGITLIIAGVPTVELTGSVR